MTLETYAKYISMQTESMVEMAKTICGCAIDAITDILIKAKSDIDAYAQLRDGVSFYVPFISKADFLSVFESRVGDFYSGGIQKEDFGHDYLIYMRECKDYGIRISGCFYDKDTGRLVPYGFGVSISPYFSSISFDRTVQTIIQYFLKEEFGKQKSDIEARYSHSTDGKCILLKGAYLIPKYDGENRLISARQR